MKTIKPPSTRRPKPPVGPALINVGEGALRVFFDDEVREIEDPAEGRRFLRQLDRDGFRIFTASKLKRVVSGLGAQHFEATLASSRLVRIQLDNGGPVVYGTRAVVPATVEGYGDLRTLWDYCAGEGVVFGSASWSSEQLLRSSLDRRLRFHARVGRKGARGGRKSFFAEGTYRRVDYVDIRSAYPSAMVSEPIPTTLHYDSSDSIEAPVGLALADVMIPDDLDQYPPLYELTRFGMLWRTGELRGWYPLRELRMARDVGCRVRPWIVYSGRNYVQPFDRWLDRVRELRDLPGSAGRLGKIIANTLWGTFANGSETRVVRFADDRGDKIDPSSVRIRRPPPPEAAFVACEIAGRVRERIFRELIPSKPIYVDTDGGVIRRERGLPERIGDELGDWSVRENFERFELVGIGAYVGHRFNGRKNVVLAGHEGIASARDVRQYGAAGGSTVIADTARDGFKGVKLRQREPWVFDETGSPVPIEAGRWQLDQLPREWSVVPPELAGMRDFEPVKVGTLLVEPERFPIPFDRSQVTGDELVDPF